MSKFKFIQEETDIFTGKVTSTTTKEFNADSLADVFSQFKDFLNGCGYVIQNEIIEADDEDDFDYDEDDGHYQGDDELEDDYWDNLSSVNLRINQPDDNFADPLKEIKVWPYENGVK